MNENVSLDQRLAEFRRKYYTDKILRGTLILALLTTSLLFVALLGEGLFGFSAAVRTAFVYLLGGAFVFTLGYMVVYPATKLARLTRSISDFDIADMVRGAFPNINDKLINLLQLRRESSSNALVAAAIAQKSGDITPIRLSNAIDLRKNNRYLRWLAIPLLLFLLIWLIRPGILASGSERLVNYDKEFLPPPPFTIEIGQLPKEIIAGQSLPLQIKVSGNELPAELSLYVKKESENEFVDFTLDKKSPTEFVFTLNEIKENITLYVGNPEVKSAAQEIAVLKRPYIKNFRLTITPPAYTGLQPEVLDENIGDFKAIKGSTVTWQLESQGEAQTASVVMQPVGQANFRNTGKNFAVSQRIMQDFEYFLSLQSARKLNNADTVRYRATMLADRFPSVYIISPNQDFFVGVSPSLPLDMEISDDFGFSKAALYYRFTKSGGTTATSADYREYPIEISKNTLLQALSKTLDLTALGMKEGDELEYFVKVWDNDGISGAKASTSGTFKVVYPTLDAKYDEIQEQKAEMKDKLEDVLKKSEALQEQYKKMQQKMLEQKQLSFDDKKELQKMLNEHNQMLKELEQSQKQMEQTKQELQQNQMISEETLQKYEQLNQYMKDLKNSEVEKMLKEMQEKMEQLKPEDIRNKMEQLKLNDEDVQKSIERTMELLKQLEVAEKVDELKNKLDNLKAKQDLLNEQLEKAKTPEEMKNVSDRQEDLNKQMDAMQKDLEDLKKLKEETKQPDKESMDKLEKMADEARENMEKAEDQSEKSAEQQQEGGKQNEKQSQQNKQSASQSQKQAAKKMKEMKDMMDNMQQESQEEEDEQNLEHLRDLLENLLKLSFDQEDLRDQVKGLKYGDPVLKDKGQQQKKLQDDMGLVRDSLESLAKQVFQIQKFVLDESSKIGENMGKSQDFFRNKQIPMITYHQQGAMTSMNNLANMLSQVMDQMQQQMKNSKPGSGMCKKPGKKPGEKPSMSEQQRQLNQQMQQMMNGNKMDPDALQKMAAQQEAIRKQLKESHEKTKQEGGKEMGSMPKMMDDMEATEQELVRQQLTQETMMRQQEILSRLLQSERAVRERDWDEQRESNTARTKESVSPDQLSKEEYKNKIRQELLKSTKLEYSADFMKLIEEYYKNIEKQ